MFSGRLGILYATQIQLGLTYFGLFAATVFLLYLQGSAIGAMPLKGIVALALIVIVCAVVHFRRRARYLDTSVRPSAAKADGPREREPTGVRLFVRLQKILNSLVGILALTLVVLAAIVTAFELFLGGAPAFAREALDALQSGTSVSAMTLISLIVLPLLHPIVDVVNWQRVAAFARLRDGGQFKDGEWTAAFKTFGVTYALEVPLMALFIVLFGAIAGLTLAGTSEGNATQVFVASLLAQENSVATAIVTFLMLGLLALAAATMGSLFSAGLDVVACDIMPTLRSQSTSAAGTADGGRARGTLIAGLVIGLLVLATFLLAEIERRAHVRNCRTARRDACFQFRPDCAGAARAGAAVGWLWPFRNRDAGVGLCCPVRRRRDRRRHDNRGTGVWTDGRAAVGRACLFRSDHIAIRDRGAGQPAGQAAS